MRDIIWLVTNTLRTTFRQRKNIFMYLFVPLLGILISLASYGSEQKTVLHVGIVNQDHQKMTNETVQFLQGLQNINITKISQQDVRSQLTSGKLDSVITFNKGYSASILSGQPSHVKITSIKGAEVTAYIKSYLNQFINNLSTMAYASNGNTQIFHKMVQDYKTSQFTLSTHNLVDLSKNNGMTNDTIGFLLMIMMISAGNMSEIILLEKERRTYYRLLSTPITMRQYLLSNIIVNMIVMIIQVLITLTIMRSFFHIGVSMAFWQAAVVMFLFSLVAVGLSLVIISFSNSRVSSNALKNLIITPTVMLSGCFWPVTLMPKALQKLSEFFPQRWTLDTLIKLQEGQSMVSLSLNLIILFAFALAFFLIAIYNFSRNTSTQSFV